MRVCFFGESYVNGVGDPTYQGWVGRLCEKSRNKGFDITAYNCGIRGATSALIARTWKAEANARLTGIDKAAVVFSYGTNDSWIQNGVPAISLTEQIANTHAILSTASQHWPTLMVGPPGLPQYSENTLREHDHRERCESMKLVCGELGVAYCDTLAVFGNFKQWPREAANYDGVHPGALGYGEMADALETWSGWVKLLQELRN